MMATALARTESNTGIDLRQRWQALKRERQVRARDAASELGASEGALIASLCGAEGEARAYRLREAQADIVKDVEALGPVMALTRNEHCVHEKIGPYVKVSINPGTGLVLGEQIDLRIFPAHWRRAFAVLEETKEGLRRSIQVFDAAGTAVHKIFQKPATNVEAFDALIARWKSEDQEPSFHGSPLCRSARTTPTLISMSRAFARIGKRCKTRTISSASCANSTSAACRRCASLDPSLPIK